MFSSQNSQVSSDANYIESCFSTYLYTGNGSTQTITNGIDLSGKGGMVWVKRRSSPANDHAVMDTARGIATNGAWTLIPNGTYDQFDTNTVTSFNSNGFTLGSSSFGNSGGGFDYASWTFRKQPKFFDVVTWTGNGVAGRQIPHNLGSVPGCIIVKNLELGTDWIVYHRGANGGVNPEQYYGNLNTTGAFLSGGEVVWGDGTTAFPPTSTYFTVYSSNALNRASNLNTYVAYVFAHNAGGFGLTGTDNVISCGSFTTDGSGNATVSLGYEPQWVLIKSSSNADGWQMVDTMRGMAVSNGLYNGDQVLQSQASSAETSGAFVQPSATGFDITYYGSSRTYIYIAIRRGPMKVPTSGTSVFSPIARAGTGANATVTGLNFPPDLSLGKARNFTNGSTNVVDRLRGNTQYVQTGATTQEFSITDAVTAFNMNGVSLGADTGLGDWNTSGFNFVEWHFGRAPSFFDEVCYTGVGYPTALTNTHNLGVAPEMMIVKKRSATQSWFVYHAAMGNDQEMYLNQAASQQPTTYDWNSTTPSATTFAVNAATNNSGATYVAYLFATCAGVSKVGSYTGTGATQTINCGFSGGARFVMVKRYDSTGDWYVWDTARGMVSGTDPSLLLNDTAAEVNANSIYTTTGGFQIVSTAAGINASGGNYIFLAIA